MIRCTTLGHEEVPAVANLTCEGEGSYHYCGACRDLLIKVGETLLLDYDHLAKSPEALRVNKAMRVLTRLGLSHDTHRAADLLNALNAEGLA